MCIRQISPIQGNGPSEATVGSHASTAEVRTPRILYVISNLEYGGAQRQVVLLVNRLRETGVDAHVCCLSDYVPLSAELQHSEACLHVVEKHSKFDRSVVPRLRNLVERLEVDVVHVFLLDAEIAARLACRHRDDIAVVGSERNTDYRRKWHQTLALRLTQSRLDGVIANSNAGKRFQKSTLGIADDKLFTVHNGVDTEKFRPGDRDPVRRELGIEPDAPVVGMFASFKRQKNHLMYFRAARRLLDEYPAMKFLCVGEQLHGGLQASDQYMNDMKSAIHSMNLDRSVMLLGNRDDTPAVYNACDVTVLTSRREGTPNVLLESMACGVPVVATDVADNRLIVPDDRVGYVVPLDDHEGMASRVWEIVADRKLRERLSFEARRWAEQEFSVDALVDKTLTVYRTILERRRSKVESLGSKV